MATHPLDPLTADEISEVVKILRDQKHLTSSTRVSSILLHEPRKQFVYSWTEGSPFPREVEFTLFDNAKNITVIGRVELLDHGDHDVINVKEIPGVQTLITCDEMEECEKAVVNSKMFQEKLREHYGDRIKMENLIVDIWSAGYYGEECDSDARLARPYCFFRDEKTKNPYAYPIEGLRPVVDLNKMEVIRVEDLGKYPLPPEHFSHWMAETTPDLRNDVKPLDVVQPQGPSFEVSGHNVSWQKWTFVVGFNAMEGLVLHDLRYDGRPILFRAAISDMVVPYGDPSPLHARKNAFDVSDYGIGYLANSLKLGCDCLGHIKYFDADLVTSRGEPFQIKNAVCMHEEDFGVLWKHFERHYGANEVRRSRRMVISMFATVENYDYGFYWYLYQDGNIQLEVKLTGFLSVGAKREGEEVEYGTFVAPQLYAPNHQHFFNFRLDFAVDGIENTVSKVDVVSESQGPHNPYMNGFYAQKSPLKTELQALENVSVETARTWEISHASKKNHVGMPVAYKFIPGDNTVPMAAPDAWWRQRARFTDHHIWVTPFDENEFRCAGDFPNQAKKDTGLIKWVQKDRNIENTDVVLWYTLGVTHIPRPEDYPVMPAVYTGFLLKPQGFFDRNPAWDVPPQEVVNKDCGMSRRARLS